MVRGWRTVLVAVLAVALLPGGAATATAFGSVRPVPGPVVRGFDPPEQRWNAGHRGVDLAAAVGSPVRAAADGEVSVAQTIAGRGVVTIVHGDLRTTYEPVRASVRVGEQVHAGDVLGTVQAGHCAAGCLHFGLKRGEQYLDPLDDSTQVRLLPSSAVAMARRLAAERAAALAAGAFESTGSGVLLNPVNGRIGSPFGRRFHPIFHEWRMHEGLDLHASCGTPIRAAADGVVQSVSSDPSGGHRLLIAHPRGLVTQYLHATGYSVHRGQRVRRGQVVGRVGSTGWATACHLHFGVKVHGRLVDPARFL